MAAVHAGISGLSEAELRATLKVRLGLDQDGRYFMLSVWADVCQVGGFYTKMDGG